MLTSGTTYNPPANCHGIWVEAFGGGGGGGGTATAAVSAAAGGGGSAGGHAGKWYANPPQGCTYALGGGGAGGANGANGTNGGDTTFTDGTMQITAKGGNGGQGMAADTTVAFATGGDCANSINGDINGAGAPGGTGVRSTGLLGVSGVGGSSVYGGGGAARGVTGNGFNGLGPSSGGGGALTLNGGVASTGGAGKPGMIVIYEYS